MDESSSSEGSDAILSETENHPSVITNHLPSILNVKRTPITSPRQQDDTSNRIRPRSAHGRSVSASNIIVPAIKEMKRTVSVSVVNEADEDLVHYADHFAHYHEKGKNNEIELEQLMDNFHYYKYTRCYFMPKSDMIRYSVSLGIEYDKYRRKVVEHYMTPAHKHNNPHLTSTQYGLCKIIVELSATSAGYMRTLLELLKANRGYCCDKTTNGQIIPFFSEYYIIILLRENLRLNQVNDLRKVLVLCPVPTLYYADFHFFEARIEEDRLEVYPRDTIKPLTDKESYVLFSEGVYRRRLQTIDNIIDVEFYLFATTDLIQINLQPIIDD